MRPVNRSVNGPCCLAKGIRRPVKRVLVGSAAALFTVVGAQAVDPPTKAQPLEYVMAPGA
jgi:hypothetical protein